MHIPQVWCDGKSSFCVVPKFGFWCKLNMALGLADSVLLATSGSSSIRKILFSYSFSDPLSLLSFSYFYLFPLFYILFLPVCNHLYFIIYISNLLRTFSFFHEPWTFFLWSNKHLSWHRKTNYLEQEITFCPEMEHSYPKSRPNF